MIEKYNLLPLIATIVLFSSLKAEAQEIDPPIFIFQGTPSLIQKLCIGQNSPNREAIAKANILFATGTEFVLELSDENGVFSNDVTRVLTRFTTPIAIPPGGDIEFPSLVTETTFTVNESNIGEVYALEATLRGTTFPTARSNDLTVEFLSDVVVIEASPAFIPFGETSTLSVPSSSNYAYEWFMVVDGENQSLVDGSTVISGQGTSSIEIDRTGDYFVRITLLDCVIDSEILSISDVAGSSEIIPNVVTPNSDGINDNWLLPPSLFNQQSVEVTIYNARGQVDFTSSSYQNNWPRENSKSSGQDPFYYYIITKNNSVVRKGSITIMK
ncbi:hypothetical protein ATO12_10745 [Aquimarina atlantica]|uniref:Gliding motility-associated C-terminal domain-containing protein n=1 Tax=Aquimarina atlantica TaxID=1317122 RepID=A0A023BYX6_9FLAO|nr:gliding motility-associated C-terminal domain-containing protein [Aquimarina atlantica]EZH75190.1 hypothetical protein ATO12_10745 [Aquimarina atlantica]